MNIFGVSKKRKLRELVDAHEDKLVDHATKHDDHDARHADHESEINDIQANPLQLTSTDIPYFPGWYFTDGTVDTSATTDQEGVAEVPTSTDVRWGFTVADSVDATKYNYVIRYKVYASNSNSQLYAGFSQKAVHIDSREGSSYATSGGWPSANVTNNFGEAIEFRLTPSFTAWGGHDPSVSYKYPASAISISSGGWPTGRMYEMKLTIVDGKISSMEVYDNGIFLRDFVSTEGWVMNLPEGPLYMYFIDTNNSPSSGSSAWKVGVSILQRTLRGDQYDLKNSIQPYPTHQIRLSTVGQRFIPYGYRVVELAGHNGTSYISADVYFLPVAKHGAGEILFLHNTSGRSLTVYDTTPHDPTISTPTWSSYTIPHGAVQNHGVFVSISAGKWHQIV